MGIIKLGMERKFHVSTDLKWDVVFFNILLARGSFIPNLIAFNLFHRLLLERRNLGWQSLVIAINLVVDSWLTGGIAGTAITLAYRQPKKAMIKSTPGGYTNSTLSSSCSLQINWDAIVLALVCSCLKVTDAFLFLDSINVKAQACGCVFAWCSSTSIKLL